MLKIGFYLNIRKYWMKIWIKNIREYKPNLARLLIKWIPSFLKISLSIQNRCVMYISYSSYGIDEIYIYIYKRFLLKNEILLKLSLCGLSFGTISLFKYDELRWYFVNM